MPEQHLVGLHEVFQHLLQGENSRCGENAKPRMGDWFTTAINSVSGNAIEAMLYLAFRQKKKGKEIEPWIFDLIRSHLESSQESPAIFALLGAHLGFFIHLFGTEVKTSPRLLFPSSRLAHQKAAIISHFRYDRATPTVIATLPELLSMGLKSLKLVLAEEKEGDANQDVRDFSWRLGIHIAIYYWNGGFPSEAEGESALDHYFEVATERDRAFLISKIASNFERPAKGEPDKNLIGRVMRIWERRYGQIIRRLKKGSRAGSSDYDGELGAFTNWLCCECFPFEWRFTHAMQAIEKLKKAPHSRRLLQTISDLGGQDDHLGAALQILRAVLAKPSDGLRLSIQFGELGPVIARGLASGDRDTEHYAAESRDLLLKLGFFEFLEIGKGQAKH